MFRRALIAAALVFAAGPAVTAHDFKSGAITIDHPTVSPAPAGRPVTAGYMTVLNAGPADRLLAAASPLAQTIELHTHSKGSDGMMRMRRVKDGVAVPKGKVVFAPGGLHLMIFGLKAPLADGDTVPITLTFAKAGQVEVVALVEAPSRGGAQHQGH